MTHILSFLSGKKTYIVGILMISLGLLQGDQHLVLEGISVMTIRAGISKLPRSHE
jgi:hypothetical protein